MTFLLPKLKKLANSNGKKMSEFRFIDLFAGVGGFHLAFDELGGECVFSSEWNVHARKTYQHNFSSRSPELFTSSRFVGDITEVDKSKIPDFEILAAGFPCQPFSQAGHRNGFDDTRGTLFFEIAEILRVKRPVAFFLENVRHILRHDEGRTYETITRTLTEDLGYSLQEFVVRASDHGLPQHRPRVFMIGFRDPTLEITKPSNRDLSFTMSDVLGGEVPREIGFTLRVGGRGSGVHDRRNWDSYLVNGEERRLTVAQAQKMQGFPDWYEFPVSEAQALKQLGNSVAVWAVRDYVEQMLRTLDIPGHVANADT